MFQRITMINYARPLRERLEARKFVSPYYWTPTKPNSGRGFYQAQKGLCVDPRGSSFDLRLELANDHLPNSRLQRTRGYYTNSCRDETMTPIVARLPHGRGFLAGWTLGEGMCGSLDGRIYADIEDAARAAHSDAEYAAEQERDRESEEDESEDD